MQVDSQEDVQLAGGARSPVGCVSEGQGPNIVWGQTYIPTAEHNPLTPGMALCWWYGINGLGNGWDDGSWVIVGLVRSQLSCFRERPMPTRQLTLISSNSHTASLLSSANHSNNSTNRGIGSCGSLSVRSVARYSQQQSAMRRSTPKQRLSVGSFSKSRTC